MAENGFINVDAFDLSHAGIEKLLRIASIKKVRVNAWVQDLTEYSFEKKYDLIISHGTLHFVEKEKWKRFVIEAKKIRLLELFSFFFVNVNSTIL